MKKVTQVIEVKSSFHEQKHICHMTVNFLFYLQVA